MGRFPWQAHGEAVPPWQEGDIILIDMVVLAAVEDHIVLMKPVRGNRMFLVDQKLDDTYQMTRWNPFEDGRENVLYYRAFFRWGKLWWWPLPLARPAHRSGFVENVTVRMRTVRAIVTLQRLWRRKRAAAALKVIQRALRRWVYRKLHVYYRPGGKLAPTGFSQHHT